MFKLIKRHQHVIVFLCLVIVLFIAYKAFIKRNGSDPLERFKDKATIEDECNQLSRELCGSHGNCGWLSHKDKCVGGTKDGPHYHSDPIQINEITINSYYPAGSYQHLG